MELAGLKWDSEWDRPDLRKYKSWDSELDLGTKQSHGTLPLGESQGCPGGTRGLMGQDQLEGRRRFLDMELLDIFVEGRPRTKGSLKPIVNWSTRKVRMEEQVKESKVWRVAVSNTAVRAVADEVMNGMKLKEGYPHHGPVIVSMTFLMPSTEYVDRDVESPIGRQYGDLDKLIRNVLDALTDAKVYADDSQVVTLSCSKKYANVAVGGVAGVAINVRTRASG